VKLTREWHKSTRSGGDGNCVRGRTPDGESVEVGDSKTPDGATLTFSAESWRIFRDAVRRGEFDL
jgi:hypothetical protein